MDHSIVNYIAAGAGVIAAIVGMLTGRQTHDALGTRSQRVYALAAVAGAAGIVAAISFDNSDIAMLSFAAVLMILAAGMLRQHSEIHQAEVLTKEQRVDVVSGLPNERLFEERLFAEHSRTKRTGQRYSIAIFEIDDFEQLTKEDQLGGMRLLAAALEESIRNTDTLGRIDDQQAGVLLVDTVSDGAVIGCDRACERFFFQSCGHSDTAHVTRPLTVSVGIASFDEDTIDPRYVIDNARLVLARLRDRGGTGIAIYERDDFLRGSESVGTPRG